MGMVVIGVNTLEIDATTCDSFNPYTERNRTMSSTVRNVGIVILSLLVPLVAGHIAHKIYCAGFASGTHDGAMMQGIQSYRLGEDRGLRAGFMAGRTQGRIEQAEADGTTPITTPVDDMSFKEPTALVRRPKDFSEGIKEVKWTGEVGATDLGGEYAAGIQNFFDEFRLAAAKGDLVKIANLFDSTRRMGGVTSDPNSWSAPPSAEEMVCFLKASGPLLIAMLGRDECRIRKVKFIQPGTDAIVYVRSRTEDHVIKMRWWLRREGDKWCYYDFEELTLPVRQAAWSEARRTCPNVVSELGLASMKLFAGDEDTGAILQALAELDDTKLPVPVKASRLHLMAAAMYELGRYADAITMADRTLAVSPDVPAAYLVRGTCHNELKQYPAAIEDADRYAERLGKDAEYYVIVGDALRGEGRDTEAITAYKNALADNPQQLDAFLGLIQVIPAGQTPTLATCYKGLGDVEEVFVTLADELLLQGDSTTLRKLIVLQKSVRPGDENIAEAEDRLAEPKAKDR